MSTPRATPAQLTIGEARRSGFAASALRHYEAEHLLTAIRDARGRRLYHRSVLRRIAFIRAAQAVGLSLHDIRQALERLPSGRTPTKADWAAVAQAWESRLTEQIEAPDRTQERIDILHRLRMPVADHLPPDQPRRRQRIRRTGGPVAASRPAPITEDSQ